MTQKEKYHFLLDNLWSAVDHVEMGHSEIASKIILDMWDAVKNDAYRIGGNDGANFSYRNPD